MASPAPIESSSQIFCSVCREYVNASAFATFRDGKLKKTCKRHGTKRPANDEWPTFLQEIAEWARQVSFQSLFKVNSNRNKLISTM